MAVRIPLPPWLYRTVVKSKSLPDSCLRQVYPDSANSRFGAPSWALLLMAFGIVLLIYYPDPDEGPPQAVELPDSDWTAGLGLDNGGASDDLKSHGKRASTSAERAAKVAKLPMLLVDGPAGEVVTELVTESTLGIRALISQDRRFEAAFENAGLTEPHLNAQIFHETQTFGYAAAMLSSNLAERLSKGTMQFLHSTNMSASHTLADTELALMQIPNAMVVIPHLAATMRRLKVVHLVRDIRYDPRLPEYYSDEFYEAALKARRERDDADKRVGAQQKGPRATGPPQAGSRGRATAMHSPEGCARAFGLHRFIRDTIDTFSANLGITPAVMDSMRQEVLDVGRTAIVWQSLELAFQQWARKEFKGRRAYMRIRLEDLGNTEDSVGRNKLLRRLGSLLGTQLSEQALGEITANALPAAYASARFAVCEPLEYSIVSTVAAKGFQTLQYSTVTDTKVLGQVLNVRLKQGR